MDEIFLRQEELQNGYKHNGAPSSQMVYTVGEIIDSIRNMSHFAQDEVSELMIEIAGDRQSLKPWSASYAENRSRKFISTDKVKSEAIDYLCFAINVCLSAGINAENVEEEYDKVRNKNLKRQSDETY